MARRKAIAQMTARELKNKIETHIRTCIRYGYATQRLCEAYNSRVGQSSGKSGFGVYIDTGRQSTIAGAGKMYEDYQKTGLLQGFTGCGITPTPFKNANSDEASIRSMTFVDTYYGLRYKITRNIAFDPAKDLLSDEENAPAVGVHSENKPTEDMDDDSQDCDASVSSMATEPKSSSKKKQKNRKKAVKRLDTLQSHGKTIGKASIPQSEYRCHSGPVQRSLHLPVTRDIPVPHTATSTPNIQCHFAGGPSNQNNGPFAPQGFPYKIHQNTMAYSSPSHKLLQRIAFNSVPTVLDQSFCNLQAKLIMNNHDQFIYQ